MTNENYICGVGDCDRKVKSFYSLPRVTTRMWIKEFDRFVEVTTQVFSMQLCAEHAEHFEEVRIDGKSERV